MSTLCEENRTVVKDIILMAFSLNNEHNIFLSLVFFLLYIFIITGNGFIIIIVCTQKQLQRPMYIFLANFSGMEICYTTVFMPKMIANLMTGLTSILFTWCVVQLYFFVSFGVAEMFLLAAMAFDRYQAICSPLHYVTVMNRKLCNWLQFICWISGFICNLPLSLILLDLDFSGNNIINHFLCDGPGLMKLSCSDTTFSDLISFILSLTTMLSCFFFTFLSYMWIIKTIMDLPSSTGKMKTFSTCSSHLTAAAMYYGTLIFMYVRPRSINMYNMNKIVSLFYTVIVPVLNPLIYSLRNKEVKNAVRKMLL